MNESLTPTPPAYWFMTNVIPAHTCAPATGHTAAIFTLRSDTSEGDLWLCPWMEAKEGEVLSHCPLRLIFNPGQGLFHPPSLTVFYWTLPKKNGWAMTGPRNSKMELGEVKCRMCGTAWRRRRGTGSVGVRGRKQEGPGGWMEERGEGHIPDRTVWTWTRQQKRGNKSSCKHLHLPS